MPMFPPFAAFALACAVHSAAEPAPDLRDLDGVWRADFNPDGSRLIVQLRDGRLGIWDGNDGTPVPGDLGTLTTRGTYVIDGAARRALVGLEGGGSRVFDLATGAALSPRLEISFEGSWNPPAGFSPDGSQVHVFEKEGACSILDVATGNKLATLSLPAVRKEREVTPLMKFGPDGGTAVVLDATGSLHRYDTNTWKATGTPLSHPDRDAYHVGFALAPDARHAVTFDSPGENGPDGTLQLWDLTTSQPIGQPLRAKNGLSARFIDNGRLLITPGRGETRVVKVPSLEPDFVLPRHDDVEASNAVITEESGHVLSWGYDGSVRRTDANTGKHSGAFTSRARVKEVFAASGGVWLTMDNTAFFLEKHYDYYVVRLDPAKMRPSATLRLTGFLHRAILSPDATRLMIHEGGTAKERIRLFDAGTLRELPCTAAP